MYRAKGYNDDLGSFTQAYGSVPFNYKMRFIGCGGAGRQPTYDVRWNVRDISTFSKLVTLSVRMLAAEGANKTPLYAAPVTMRSYVSY